MLYFDNYLSTLPETAFDTYRGETQAYINSQWHDSPLWCKVKEETQVGSFEFEEIEVWKNTVSEFTLNIIKDSSDFRRLMFKDVYKDVGRGRYYEFNNNYWLVYESTNEESPYKEVLVRRCNNVAKWIDKDTGEIIEQPCVLEYDISATNPKVDKDIIVANQSITLVLQGNEKTHKLKRNDRFIFNNLAYKFVAYNNYMQKEYVDDSVNLLFMDLDLDIDKPYDDFENNIADRWAYDYVVSINENPQQQLSGFSGVLSANVTLNGNAIDKQVVWSCTDGATIDENGGYTIIGDVGDIVTFTATYGSFSDSIDVEIVGSLIENNEIVIEPIVEALYEQESIDMFVDLYINGVAQGADVIVSTSGADQSCYELIKDGNIFILTNIHRSTQPLNITFSVGEVNKTISVKLKALF